jgi:hypothetical protein
MKHIYNYIIITIICRVCIITIVVIMQVIYNYMPEKNIILHVTYIIL